MKFTRTLGLAAAAFSCGITLGQQQGSNSFGTSAQQVSPSGRNSQSGLVVVQQSPISGVTQSVSTINSSISVQGAYGESVVLKDVPAGSLTLDQAIAMGLKANLGLLDEQLAQKQTHAGVWQARSSLLPNLSGQFRELDLKNALVVSGLRPGLIPGINFPNVVGPYNYFDLRATMTQSLMDVTAVQNYRSAKSSDTAARYAALDARDIVVQAVAGIYLQALTAQERVDQQRTAVASAAASLDQTAKRRQEGLNPQLDVNRAQESLRTEQQRLLTLENDAAKQKLNLGRVIGYPPDSTPVLTDTTEFEAMPALTYEEALHIAWQNRADLGQAKAAVEAEEHALYAAQAERLPSAGFSGDYGIIGTNPPQSNPTYTVQGTVKIPLWQGGKVEGDVQQAKAALIERRAELSELQGRIGNDLRSAFLDLAAAASQIDSSAANIAVTRQNLDLTLQRFDAGVTDSVEVTQARQSVAAAQLDYSTALLAHNLAKIALARTLGNTQAHVEAWVKIHSAGSP